MASLRRGSFCLRICVIPFAYDSRYFAIHVSLHSELRCLFCMLTGDRMQAIARAYEISAENFSDSDSRETFSSY
jgi:hypothetical protein